MISIFPADTTDFSSNGLCALEPSSCLVNETLNGEWELSLAHPLDEQNRWAWLQVGNIIKAPVPAAITPRVKLMQASEGKDIYRVQTVNGGPVSLWSKPSWSSTSLGKYKVGSEVQVVASANENFNEVITHDGKRGYIGKAYLVFVRTETTQAIATGQVVEARQLREQPFRIYRIVPELTQVTVYARHIFYDLLDNMVYTYKPANGTVGSIAANGILNGCQTAHLFTVFSDLTKTVDGMDIQNANPVEALMGEGGLLDLTSGELARDWYDIYAVTRVGRDTDIQIRQGKNLLGISYDVDDANVVTRIVPTGETKDGEILYLDQKYVDSPIIGNYPHPRWIHLPVSEAKVSDDLTVEQAKAKLLQAAQDEFEKGCDLPDLSIDVDFINLADTLEYAQYKPLTDIFLGDGVRVIVQKLGLEIALRMTEYSYDCLLKRYAKMTLGMASETMSTISSRQLPAGGIKGMKLALGSVGTGHLQFASIGSLQVRTAAIGSAHIQNAAIETAHIQDATIATAKIQDAAITNAKIGTAAIETANIKDASITNAKIVTAAIETANIKDAAITNAKIGTAAIDTANIKDAAITNAKIGTAVIQTANIQDASITTAKIGLEQVHSSNIVDAAITDAKIANAAITTAKIEDAAITSAKIQDAAITTALISDATITAAKIGTAAIETAAIKDAAITNAKIGVAAVDTANIKDATIETAKIADAAITTAKVGTAAIDTANIKDAAITNAKIGLAAVDTAKIQDAAITNAKIGTAAIQAANIQDGSITRLKVADGAIGNAQIGNAAIDSAKIGNAAIQTAHIGTGVVGTEQVADGSITDAKIIGLTANKITAGTINAADINVINLNAGNLTVGTINGQQIANNAIGSQHIGAGAINSSMMIAGGVINAAHIGDGVITAAQIADGTISGEKIQLGAIAAEKLKISQHLIY